MPTSVHACGVVRSILGVTVTCLVLDVAVFGDVDTLSEEEKEKVEIDGGACVSVLSQRIDRSALSGLSNLSAAVLVEDLVVEVGTEGVAAVREGA